MPCVFSRQRRNQVRAPDRCARPMFPFTSVSIPDEWSHRTRQISNDSGRAKSKVGSGAATTADSPQAARVTHQTNYFPFADYSGVFALAAHLDILLEKR